jgi:cytochrome P450 family 144
MSTDIAGTALLDPAVIDDPYPFYRRLQSEAPVWNVPGTDVFTVSTYPLLAEAASRVEDFSSHIRFLLYRDEVGLPSRLPFDDAGVDALATADPPMHKFHRDVVFSELVAKRMEALEPEVSEIALRCLRSAITDQNVDFMGVVGNIVPITVMSRLIGLRESDPTQLLEAAFDSTSMLGATVSLAELEVLIGRTLDVEVWIAEQLVGAAENPNNEILGAVARGIADGVFTLQEGGVILHTLLSAGGESTTSLIGNAVRMLAEDQALQDHLRDCPEKIPAFIEESLRLESPFRFQMRTIPADTLLGGVEIPAGATVLLLFGAANRDSSTFENGDAIDLNRKVPRRHVAFGRGIHHCVGAPLARLEARVVLSRLLELSSEIRLDPRQPPRWVSSLMVRRHEQLAVRITPR